jgi:hypothetical protein
MDTLKKNISGSIEGDASQKDMTGARGTPPASSAHITGITPQEQKGLKAPISVASNIDMTGRPLNARPIFFDAPETWTATANGMVIIKYGQMWRKPAITVFKMIWICSIITVLFIVLLRWLFQKFFRKYLQFFP